MTADDVANAIAFMRANSIPPATIDGEECYVLRLHSSRLQEAIDLGLAPFSLIDGSPWIEAVLPAGVA